MMAFQKKNLCSMYYITVDDAICKILELGPGTELTKIDVKGAFRLIPVNPLDRHLLAMEWRGVSLLTHASHLTCGQPQSFLT